MKTETKHTPGPWQVCGTEIWAGRRRITIGRGAYDEKDAAVRNANARLISASPDLLREAILAVERLTALGDSVENLEGLRAAIAKAEGR